MNSKKSILRQALLFDIYGGLLTDKRRATMELYCEEDLSYGEIAERQGISRQAVLNCVRHCEDELENYETALGLVTRYERSKRCIGGLRAAVAAMAADGCNTGGIIALIGKLENEII